MSFTASHEYEEDEKRLGGGGEFCFVKVSYKGD